MKTIYDLMTKDVVTITKNANLNEIIKIMKEGDEK
jgi:CBS domain-containing protein